MTEKRAICGLIALAFAPACLGDDPDHMQPVDTPAIQSTAIFTGIGRPLPVPLHQRLLAGIGTTVAPPDPQAPQLAVDLARSSAVTVAAPELCDSCSVTLFNELTGAGNTITVFDDTSNVEICQIQLALTVDAKRFIRADTCGAVASQQFAVSLVGLHGHH